MKTSTLLTAGFYLLLASQTLSVMAADPRLNSGYSAAPSRGLFGIPLPQQWTGTRPTGISPAYSPSGYRQPGYSVAGYPVAGYQTTGSPVAGYSPNCPNGNCQTGYRPQSGSCANGQCSTTGCANGQCSTTGCANGQCLTGGCANGQCATGASANSIYPTTNCPGGKCGTNPYANGRLPMAAQNDWSPRSSRVGLTDHYSRTGNVSDRDAWTQRTLRPALAPLDDAFNSRYRQDDLDLRNEYFGNESGAGYDQRSNSRTNSNQWNRPSQRSMEAPVQTHSGVARF